MLNRRRDLNSFFKTKPTGARRVKWDGRPAPILPASLQTDGPQLRGFFTKRSVRRGFVQPKQAPTRNSCRPKRRSQCREN